MVWVKRIGLGLLVLILAAGAGSYVLYRIWLNDITTGLASDSTVAQTARGPVEYVVRGSGAPILLVHGTPGGYDTADFLSATHADMKAARYIVPSRPGYLRTPLSTGATPDEQAQAFAALLDTLKIPKVAVIGTSGGGPAAIAFAIRYPERCAALVLEEALTRRTPPRQGRGILDLPAIQDYLVWLFGGALEASWQARAPNDPDIPAISRALLRSAIPWASRSAGQINDMRQFERLPDFALDRITCPTLVLQGTADQNVDPSNADYAHAHIAGSTLIKLPGYDHFMVVYAHGKLSGLIAEFLRTHVTR